MESNQLPPVTAEGEKYCTECRWIATTKEEIGDDPNKPGYPIRKLIPLKEPVCLNPKQGRNLVTKEPRALLCSYHRGMMNWELSCGDSGKWWEQREGGLDRQGEA
jgi:hypothetical protein